MRRMPDPVPPRVSEHEVYVERLDPRLDPLPRSRRLLLHPLQEAILPLGALADPELVLEPPPGPCGEVAASFPHYVPVVGALPLDRVRHGQERGRIARTLMFVAR